MKIREYKHLIRLQYIHTVLTHLKYVKMKCKQKEKGYKLFEWQYALKCVTRFFGRTYSKNSKSYVIFEWQYTF